jgi:hypothetical protein
MEESVKPSSKEPKAPMTPQQRKAKKAELHRLIMKGIRDIGKESRANKLA